jgi:hypothetical protein
METCWLDELLPPEPAQEPGWFMSQLRFAGRPIPFGPLDELSLVVISKAVAARRPLLFEIPRGEHQFALTSSLFLQVARLEERARHPGHGLDFRGPIVVIALDTRVQERLAQVSIGGIGFGEGELEPARIRFDGRMIDRLGNVLQTRGETRRVLYLNTRVGWPRPRIEGDIGVALIDRTTFGNLDNLEKALAWAAGLRAASTIVLADAADTDCRDMFLRAHPQGLCWSWGLSRIEHVAKDEGAHSTSHLLSINAIGGVEREGVAVIRCLAPRTDAQFRSVWHLLTRAASRHPGPPPAPILAARKLANGLVRLPSTVGEHDKWAALDARTRTLAGVHARVASASAVQFPPEWKVTRETVWPQLRADLMDIFSAISQDNPKLVALADTLAWLRTAHSGRRVIIRVPSEAVGHAMQQDLDLFQQPVTHDSSPIRWATEQERLPSADGPVIELYPGSIGPWHLPRWASGESNLRLHLVYDHEMATLHARLATFMDSAIQASADGLHIVGVACDRSSVRTTVALPEVRRFGSAKVAPPLAEVSLSVDSSLLWDDLGGDSGVEFHDAASPGMTDDLVPLVLEPGTDCWWVRSDATIEVIAGAGLRMKTIAELNPGDRLLVPRGEGREALFTRLVKASKTSEDMSALEVFLSRWRKACHNLYLQEVTWDDCQRVMFYQGSRVGAQAIRSWANGTVIGPDNPQDVRRVGVLLNDSFLLKAWERIAAVMTEVRGFHAKLGHLISGAYAELPTGRGPNLTRICDILHIDAVEFLEEFDVRVFRNAGKPASKPSSLIGRLLRC